MRERIEESIEGIVFFCWPLRKWSVVGIKVLTLMVFWFVKKMKCRFRRRKKERKKREREHHFEEV